MMPDLSANTQAVLLLTSPLIVGRKSTKADLLSAGEYKRLALRLHEAKYEPADLISVKSAECLQACRTVIEVDRLQSLLERGFQLSQALERWHARAIWVVSRADPNYPQRIKKRLRGNAPAILYGCGDMDFLDAGGLAVVGSRHVEDSLIEFTMGVGRLAAQAKRSIVSGGAKGIDQAAMRGALEAGGRVCGVLADSLERQVMNREHRNMLLDGQLVLVSPYDPNAGFNVGHAMQRNKLIYAFADASLVVSSDVGKGGTWTGAVEQLDKLKLVPVYVRSSGNGSPGLEALRGKGALSWPDPENAESLQNMLDTPVVTQSQDGLALFEEGRLEPDPPLDSALDNQSISRRLTPITPITNDPEPPVPKLVESNSDGCDLNDNASETLFRAARDLIERLLGKPMKDSEVAKALSVNNAQARAWLNRLVDEGILEKQKKPVTYVIKTGRLFD